MYDGVYSDFSKREEIKSKRVYAKFNEDVRAHSFVSCWHLNEYESAAMWDLYVKNNEGITIQSNLKRFKDSFKNTEESIMIGQVKYIDFEKDSNYSNQGFELILTKRLSFEHEKEIRAVYNFTPIEKIKTNRHKIDHGKNIKVDLVCLIENVYIAPAAPIYFTIFVYLT
ncbi:DUF2971 domain-containing protein [Virgibacillus oceani]